MSGLARAVTGKGMRELIRVELAQPLNTDGLHSGPTTGTSADADSTDHRPSTPLRGRPEGRALTPAP